MVAMALTIHTSRVCGTDDPVLSLVLTGRGTDLARTTPCRLSNVLPLRVNLTPELTWRRLASQITEDIDMLRSYQRCRGEELRGKVLATDSGNFFGPTLNYVPWSPLRNGDLTATVTPIATITPTEDFALYLQDRRRRAEDRAGRASGADDGRRAHAAPQQDRRVAGVSLRRHARCADPRLGPSRPG